MQQTARPRTVRTPSVHSHAREPTHGPCTPHQSLINDLMFTDQDSKTPSDQLSPPSYPATLPLSASTEDRTLQTPRLRHSYCPSIRLYWLLKTPRLHHSYCSLHQFLQPRQVWSETKTRTKETPKKSWQRLKEQGPWTETQTRFRNKVVYSARKLFLSALFCVWHKVFLSIV